MDCFLSAARDDDRNSIDNQFNVLLLNDYWKTWYTDVYQKSSKNVSRVYNCQNRGMVDTSGEKHNGSDTIPPIEILK